MVRILQHIDKKGEATVGDVAKHLRVSHNTASEHVKRLMKKGFVRKSRSGSDERKVIVVLTQEGKTALHRHTMLAEEKLKRLLNHFSAADLETIQKAFALLSEGTKRCFSRKDHHFRHHNRNRDGNCQEKPRLWRCRRRIALGKHPQCHLALRSRGGNGEDQPVRFRCLGGIAGHRGAVIGCRIGFKGFLPLLAGHPFGDHRLGRFFMLAKFDLSLKSKFRRRS